MSDLPQASVFDPDPTIPLPERTRAVELAVQAVAQLRKSHTGGALSAVDAALDLDPACTQAILAARQIELNLGSGWRKQRESAALRELEQAWDTERRGRAVLRQAAFHDAPRVMSWLRQRAAADGHGAPPPPSTDIRVSVIVPAFNRPESVKKTLYSVLRQTDPRWELILVDDASTDSTGETMRKLRERHKGRAIKVVELDRNQRLPGARKAGLDAAEPGTEFVLFLDSDDAIAPRYLEKTFAAADSHPDAGWIAPLTVQFGDVNRLFGFERFDLPTLLQRNQFNVTCLIRRKLLEDIGPQRVEMTHGLEDWDFWVRAAAKGYQPFQIREPLFFYERRGANMLGGMSRDPETGIAARLQLLAGNPGVYQPADEIARQLLRGAENIPQQLVRTRVLPAILRRSNPLASTREHGGQIPALPVQEENRISVSDFKGKRILFVCHDFPPFKWAGAQLYAFHLAKELQRLGHDVHVLHPVDLSRVASEGKQAHERLDTEFDGLPVTRIVVDDTIPDISLHPQYSFGSPGVERVFETYVQDNCFDIVHVHLLYRLSAELPRIARESGARTIATLHDYWLLCTMGHLLDSRGRECIGPENPEKCARCLNGFREAQPNSALVGFFRQREAVHRAAWSQFDCVLCPSRFLADTHVQYGFPAPEIHPLGWLPLERRPHSTDPHRIIFGFAGQIVYRKGLDVLLKALLKVRRTNWELHVYGRPYQESYFARMKEALDRHPRMYYKGGFTPDDLSRIYGTFDVAVLPSRRENYPLTLLEGLSAGVPVIASRVGGVPEMLEEGRDGFIFANEDDIALTGIIERILENPDLPGKMRGQMPRPKTIAEDAVEMAAIYEQMLRNP